VAGTQQMLAQEYKHPPLAILTLPGACILALGWLSIPTLLQVPIPLWLTIGGLVLASTAPLFALTLFDQRR